MPQILRSIAQINRCAHQYRSDMLAPSGLKGFHASYLIEICSKPGISQDHLAKRIASDKSNVARQAAVLEEGGFISRRPSVKDKRVMELYPTEKALLLLPSIVRGLSDWEQYLTEGLTPEEIETVTRILFAMREKSLKWMEVR